MDGTGLKLEDTIRKVDNRSAWKTTIRKSAAYTLGLRTAKGKARQGNSTRQLH